MLLVVGLAFFTCNGNTPDVKFAESKTPNVPDPFTPEMRKAYKRFHNIHDRMDKQIVDAAVDQLIEDFAKHNPRVFVPMVIDDLMHIAPKDTRTILVLRKSLKEGWIDAIAAHGYFVQAGEPPQEHIDYLVKQLDAPNIKRRIAAIGVLGMCGAKAKDALPRLERIVQQSNAPAEDYVKHYNIESPMPEHVCAKVAIDRIKQCLNKTKSPQVNKCPFDEVVWCEGKPGTKSRLYLVLTDSGGHDPFRLVARHARAALREIENCNKNDFNIVFFIRPTVKSQMGACTGVGREQLQALADGADSFIIKKHVWTLSRLPVSNEKEK